MARLSKSNHLPPSVRPSIWLTLAMTKQLLPNHDQNQAQRAPSFHIRFPSFDDWAAAPIGASGPLGSLHTALRSCLGTSSSRRSFCTPQTDRTPTGIDHVATNTHNARQGALDCGFIYPRHARSRSTLRNQHTTPTRRSRHTVRFHRPIPSLHPRRAPSSPFPRLGNWLPSIIRGLRAMFTTLANNALLSHQLESKTPSYTPYTPTTPTGPPPSETTPSPSSAPAR